MEKSQKLSVATKLKYGVGDLGMAIVTAMLQFSMLFYYTDVVGVSPGLAGTAMLVGKITWDLVNDVLFGYRAHHIDSNQLLCSMRHLCCRIQWS